MARKKSLRVTFDNLVKSYVMNHPQLTLDLMQSNSRYAPADFVKRTLLSSLYMALGFSFLLILFLAKMEKNVIFGFIAYPMLHFLFFSMYIKSPALAAKKIARKIDSEIVYATRFLIIEVESGVPIYTSFRNVAHQFKYVGHVFQGIISKVDTGDELDKAISDAITLVPSNYLRNVLTQILNTLTTGANLAIPLSSVLDQIIKEQLIELNEYSRKLNPLSMFYMMVAVIIPTLGITMFVVLSTFLNIQLSLTLLLVISGFFAFIQFMFYSMIKTSRPAVEL